jgi:hypothetical protein
VTVWTADVEATIQEALEEVGYAESGREHLGRPFITAYQLAIKVHRLDPQLAVTLGVDIGGEGVGQYTSLAQYLARQLSRRIRELGTSYDIEGAQLSGVGLVAMDFRHPGGGVIASSNVGAGFDLTMFRVRRPAG